MSKTIKHTETLFVFRTRESWYNLVTTLKDEKGKVKAILVGHLHQPKKWSKEIKLRNNTFQLNWDNVN